jgi:hypothetical protein
MPYYPNIQLLFIHIPKTAGTSFNKYIIEKYNINLNKYTNIIGLYYLRGPKRLSLQHMTYDELMTCKYISINKENLKIVTIVRNPYTRLISELFYQKTITLKTSKEEIYTKIKNLFNDYKNDNHIRPQHEFISGITDIIILKQENLKND